jgi:hypothetical protein
MRAPQIIMLIIFALKIALHGYKHDESMGEYHVGFALFSILFYALLLWWGGFWS